MSSRQAPRSSLWPTPTELIVGIGGIALLFAVAPFIPEGTMPAGAQARGTGIVVGQAPRGATAEAGTVTPEMRAEIDRVVREGRRTSRALSARSTPAALVAALVRCAVFDGQTYCLDHGWTTESRAEVIAEMTAGLEEERSKGAENTGGDVLGALQQRAALNPRARAAEERRELTDAARSVAKLWLLRHQIEGVALPDGFLADHPEARAAGTDAQGKDWGDYPQADRILDKDRTSEQVRTYWCGPASMQMIAWNWHKTVQRQRRWANRLGTTSSGTGITDMVRVTNAYTGWDSDAFAGRYITLDVGTWDFPQWWLLQMRHVHDYRAPLILHPILLKQFYAYLDDDASGHFQVGRGYDKNGDKTNLIGYFEPWNQQRFDPSEPYIGRVQWRSAYKSYRANEEHFQHNIGV